MKATKQQLNKKIRVLIVIFIVFLVLSGVTAFPLQWELGIFMDWMQQFNFEGKLAEWLNYVGTGVMETANNYPFIAYGTDWLAFAHLVIGVAFIGPYMNPVKNIWTIQFGMIACAMIIPLALIAGPVRQIPMFWQLIDCSFGIIGIIPLYICYKWIKQLELLTKN